MVLEYSVMSLFASREAKGQRRALFALHSLGFAFSVSGRSLLARPNSSSFTSFMFHSLACKLPQPPPYPRNLAIRDTVSSILLRKKRRWTVRGCGL